MDLTHHRRVRLSDIIWAPDMARKPDTLAYVLGMALSLAITAVAITTWASPPDPENEATATLLPKQPIYRPQNWTVY
jgi:hypothetical protein